MEEYVVLECPTCILTVVYSNGIIRYNLHIKFTTPPYLDKAFYKHLVFSDEVHSERF